MSNVAKLKKKAAEFEQKRQFDKALAVYVQMLEGAARREEEVEVALYNRVGDLFLREGKTSEALTYYEKAVDRYAESGFFNNAIALCNKILRHAPGRSVVYYKLGKISAQKGFTSDAKQNFLEYADRMRRAGQMDEAFRALREFADLCPDQDDIRTMLAEQLTKADRKDEAVEQLQRLYEKFQEEGRSDESRQTLDRMKAIDPTAEPNPVLTPLRQNAQELVFLDVSYDDEPDAQRNAETPSATQSVGAGPEPDDRRAAPPTAPAPSGVDSLPARMSDGFDGQDAPEPIEGAPAAPAILDMTGNADALGGAGSGFGVMPPLEPPGAHGLSLDATSHASGDTLAGLGEAAGPLSVSEFGSLQLGNLAQSHLPTPTHDLVLPGELPPLDQLSLAATASGPLDLMLASDFAVGGSAAALHGAESPGMLGMPGGPLDASLRSPTDVEALPELHGAFLEPVPYEAPGGDAPDEPSRELPFLDVAGDFDGGRATPDAAPAGASGAAASPLPGEFAAFEPQRWDGRVGGAAQPDGEASTTTGASNLIDLPLISEPDVGPARTHEPAQPDQPAEDVVGGAAWLPQAAAPRFPAETRAPGGPTDALAATAPLGGHERASRSGPTLDDLRAAVERDHDVGAPRRQLAEALLENGDREAGLRELDLAMTAYERADDLDEARSVAEEIIHIEPNSVRHHQKCVEYAFRAGDKSRLCEAYLALADALFRTGQTEKARAVYKRVLELAPEDRRARAALGAFPGPAAGPAPRSAATRETASAPRASAPAAAPARAASPDRPVGVRPPPATAADEDRVNLGDWLRADERPKSTRMVIDEQAPSGDEQADFDDMLRKFKQGVAENVEEDDHESHYDLGVAFKEMGLLDEAIAEFQKALRAPGRRVRTYEALGQCFMEKQQLSVALTILQRALSEPGVADDQLVGVLYLLGYASEALQRRDDAAGYYQRVFAVDIQFRDVADRLNALDKAVR